MLYVCQFYTSVAGGSLRFFEKFFMAILFALKVFAKNHIFLLISDLGLEPEAYV